jgi:4'-phosphopantetheinyl transferase
VTVELERDTVHLWFWFPERACRNATLDQFEALLSDDELARYSQLRFPEHRREYLVSHALLRATLARYADTPPLDIRFQQNAFGKPELVGTGALADLRFNMSHTHGLAVCAITRCGDVGADVEYHTENQALLEIADHYFSPREVDDLLTLPEAQRRAAFFHYWTLKESYIKARGEGLSLPLDSFSFLLRGESIGFESSSDPSPESWRFFSLQPAADYSCAVALRCSDSIAPRLQLFTADLHGWQSFDPDPLAGVGR